MNFAFERIFFFFCKCPLKQQTCVAPWFVTTVPLSLIFLSTWRLFHLTCEHGWPASLRVTCLFLQRTRLSLVSSRNAILFSTKLISAESGFFVLIFLLFRQKNSAFRINCFKFTQYFAKISRLIIIIIIIESFVTYASKLMSIFVNNSKQLYKMYKIYFQLNYFMIFWQTQMKQVWWNKIYSVQLLKQFLRDLIVFILHNQTLIIFFIHPPLIC